MNKSYDKLKQMPSLSRIEHLLLRCVKFIVYLIPFLPLYIASSVMFPYITGKNFAFRMLVEIAAVFWAGLLATNREYRLHSSPMIFSMLIFTLTVGLADLFGVNPYISFWSSYERMEGYITILHLLLFFLIIKSIFKTKRDWINFFSICVVVSICVSLFTIIEPFSVVQAENYIEEYGMRKAGTIGNPPFLSSYLLFSVFLGLLLILITQKTYLRLLYLFSVILNTTVIYRTASRGAILAAIIGAVVIVTSLFLRRHGVSDKKSLKKAVVTMIIGLFIILSVGFFAGYNSDLIKNDKTLHRFAMIFNADPSVESRLYAWKMAWNGFKEKPIMGWGQENYIGVYTVNPIPHEGKLVWMDRAHNIVLDWLINAGILGLSAYLAIYGTVFYILWDNFRRKIISANENIIIATAFIVYFIQNLFTFDTISSYIIFFALLAYIDSLESVKTTPGNSDKNSGIRGNRIQSVIATFIASVIFSLNIYYVNYIPIKQLRLYTKISTSLPGYKSFSTMLDDFNKALSYKSFGDNYIREEMASVSKQILQNQLYGQEGALSLIQAAAEEMEEGIYFERHNLEYIFRVYGFYELLASYNPAFIPKAEALIERCLRINPEFSRIDMDKVNLFFIKKDYESAYIKLKEFVDRHPDATGWRFKLALASILTHREDEAEQGLKKIGDSRIADRDDVASGDLSLLSFKQLDMLARAYMEVKNYKYALASYKEMLSLLSIPMNVRLFKDDTQLSEEDKIRLKAKLHMEIAKLYMLLDDKENAEREFTRASKLR